MTLPSTNLLCEALHRASPDPEGLSHLQETHAFRKLVSHLPFDRTIYLGPAEFHALRYRAIETCFDLLTDHRFVPWHLRCPHRYRPRPHPSRAAQRLAEARGFGFRPSVRPC